MWNVCNTRNEKLSFFLYLPNKIRVQSPLQMLYPRHLDSKFNRPSRKAGVGRAGIAGALQHFPEIDLAVPKRLNWSAGLHSIESFLILKSACAKLTYPHTEREIDNAKGFNVQNAVLDLCRFSTLLMLSLATINQRMVMWYVNLRQGVPNSVTGWSLWFKKATHHQDFNFIKNCYNTVKKTLHWIRNNSEEDKGKVQESARLWQKDLQ